MNPQETQTAVLAWAAVAIAVISALSNPIINLITKIKLQWELAQHKAELEKQIALQAQQIEQNTTRLNGQSGKIDTLLLNAPPPNQPPTVAVAVSGGSEPGKNEENDHDQ